MNDAAINYLKSIDADDTVLIVHHWDMDGSAAAAVTSKILEQQRGRGADQVIIPKGRQHKVGERAERLITEDQVTKLIVLDMNDDADRIEELHDLGPDVLIVDHHNIDEVPSHAVIVNPRLEDPDAYVPAAKLCNDLAAAFGLDLDWIAGLGIVQDFAVAGHEDVFERLREEYPAYFPDEITQHNMAKRCRYGKISSIMNIKPYKDTDRCAELAHAALLDATGLEQLELQTGFNILQGYYRDMYKEIDRVVTHYDEEREIYPEEQLIFFQFSSAFHINSSIATRISLDEEDWVHVIANTQDGRVNISARCQSGRVDLGRILQQALPENAPGEAGGHRKAAGASVPTEHLDAFKENLVRELSPA